MEPAEIPKPEEVLYAKIKRQIDAQFLEEFRNDESANYTLVAEGGRPVRVSRLVLKAMCPFFRHLFQQPDFVADDRGETRLPFSFDAVRTMAEFLYARDNIETEPMSCAQLRELVGVARYLQMDELHECLGAKLEDRLLLAGNEPPPPPPPPDVSANPTSDGGGGEAE